ncbi:unnamed protein product [Spirodela intermedia]|uniref:Cupin type-1 domain-containing protein n=1 Tax=Spirodela intermedia TaxID=51605 RepID=A0A7I8JIL5_SPIIN|nr:unnamed protein product [Spirodela intermedia]CAA6669771.1 unnamed protein product [Spirodela intermedia]
MEVEISPKESRKAYGGEGGEYYAWSAGDLPMLAVAEKGAAKLVLGGRGLAIPSYSTPRRSPTSSKVRSGRAGIVLPEASERVVAIRKGDAIALPFGAVAWWFNDSSEADLTVLFLGDTSKAHKRGEFTDFQLTGASGIFTGFTAEFAGRAFDLSEQEASRLVRSQPSGGIVKLKEGFQIPEPSEMDREGLRGGRVVVVSSQNLPLVGDCGFGGDLVKLNGGAMCSPGFSCDSAFQVTYITKGSGRVQVVGIEGKRVLETAVKAGSLFIVPRFFVVSKIADAGGMQWFSIVTTPNPVFTHLAGKTSVWKALSPQVLKASFNVSPETEELFRSKRTSTPFSSLPPANCNPLRRDRIRQRNVRE